jgi:hypothetical protein
MLVGEVGAELCEVVHLDSYFSSLMIEYDTFSCSRVRGP